MKRNDDVAEVREVFERSMGEIKNYIRGLERRNKKLHQEVISRNSNASFQLEEAHSRIRVLEGLNAQLQKDLNNLSDSYAQLRLVYDSTRRALELERRKGKIRHDCPDCGSSNTDALEKEPRGETWKCWACSCEWFNLAPQATSELAQDTSGRPSPGPLD